MTPHYGRAHSRFPDPGQLNKRIFFIRDRMNQ